MNKNEKNAIEKIRVSLTDGNFSSRLTPIIEFIDVLLPNINDFSFYDDNLVSKELIDIYNKRLINLSEKGVLFGGFSETIMSLEEEKPPSHMVTTDVEKYHISILMDDATRVVGAMFVEH